MLGEFLSKIFFYILTKCFKYSFLFCIHAVLSWTFEHVRRDKFWNPGQEISVAGYQ